MSKQKSQQNTQGDKDCSLYHLKITKFGTQVTITFLNTLTNGNLSLYLLYTERKRLMCCFNSQVLNPPFLPPSVPGFQSF
uniref:Uncharacterized protein n=1 Tax=Arundo donax TaxID=35708 RepID=A0A0A9BVY3_ARUDO